MRPGQQPPGKRRHSIHYPRGTYGRSFRGVTGCKDPRYSPRNSRLGSLAEVTFIYTWRAAAQCSKAVARSTC